MINIDDLIGVRYCHNGRSIKTGFDCYGLAIEISKRFGHELPDLEEFLRADREFDVCEKLCLENVKVKPIEKPEEEGDLILIKSREGVLEHIGVYLGHGRFIHCNRLGVHLDSVMNYEHLIERCYTWL